MRILHIIHNIDKAMGGSVYAVQNIIKMEKELGYDSHILTLSASGADQELLEFATVHVMKKSFPSRYSRSIEALDWLQKNAKNYQLSVIHSIWGLHQIECARVLFANKMEYVIWPHGSLDPFDLRKKHVLKNILGPIVVRPMLEGARSIVCTSSQEQQVIECYGCKDILNFSVLPLPVPFQNKGGIRDRFRLTFGIPNDRFVFLFLSRINYKKGIELTLQALKTLSEAGIKPMLVIAGSGEPTYVSRIKRLVQRLGISDSVIFAGFLAGDERNDAYVGSDCFALASLNENFGIAPIESLASGTPVIISKNVYIWEELLKSNVVYICEYEKESSVFAMKQCMQCSLPIERREREAKNTASKYSLDMLRPCYEEFYSTLVMKHDVH